VVAKVLRGEGEGPAPAFAGQPRRQQPMRPWRGVSSGESARLVRPRARASSPPPWPAGDGVARAAHGRDNSVRRRRGPGEDHPGRRDGYCRAPAATATNRSPFRNLGSGTGLRPGRPDPGTTRRPFRKSFYKMRSVMIVQSRSRYGSHPWPRRLVPGSLPVGPGHDQWSAGQKKWPAGRSPFAGIARIRSWGSPFSL